ncbi:MAG: DotU family type IV/VI secretion system protein [Planctomycetota bacterium]|nr:DotU family type IV/VI secretion system protein [Planctomycetota bacterium]
MPPKSRRPKIPSEFYRAVDPLFLSLIALIGDQGELNKKSERDIREVQKQIDDLIRGVNSRLGERSDWVLARYAIVCWIDDVVINSECDGNNWWKNNPLERLLYPDELPDAAIKFFQKGDEAARLPGAEALSVFVVCLVLGFKGAYLDAEGDSNSPQYQRLKDIKCPPTRAEWLDQKRARLKKLRERRPEPEPEPIVGDPTPLMGSQLLIQRGLLAVVLSVVAGYVYFFVFQSTQAKLGQ